MAGHGKRREPSSRWLERAAKAVTPDDQLAVAYDRLRALIADLRKNIRDSDARALRQRRADNEAATAATLMHEWCDRIEREERESNGERAAKGKEARGSAA